METARFCGNCGNPFPRGMSTTGSSVTSSLITCAQGHIYSAVYEHCPYCPQPEQASAPEFATRIEEPGTTSEPPPAPAPPPVKSGFETRTDTAETIFEATVLVPVSTDPLKSVPTVDSQVGPTAPTKRPAGATTVASGGLTPEPAAPPPPPPPPRPEPPRPERRTVVVGAEDLRESLAPRGRLAGWLVTFDQSPDGRDFRLRVGSNRIGANPHCDVVIDDEAVSGSHAIIMCRDGQFVIKDDFSSNGTFVNESEVSASQTLRNYDQVRVGNTTLTLVALERLD